jgi:cytidine deaminase
VVANAAIDSSKPGAQNVGKGDGSQFITGQCLSNADCASTCCNKNTGLCNAIGAVGIENCGFGGAGAVAAAPAVASPAVSTAAPAAAANPAIDQSKPGAQNVGKGNGSQFITGQCLSNADCASTCCNKKTGLCNAIGAVGIENCGFQGA